MAESTLAVPQGFRAAACSSGIKKSGKLDMALICADQPVECAGVFTTNKVVAAPVKLTESRVSHGLCQAILINRLVGTDQCHIQLAGLLDPRAACRGPEPLGNI
ncbi:MAG: bifunctional ornithine acetyltransferase/N-acetylglutamate synthase [Desulfuromonadales bacterium]